jgi:8-oxo-dGTP pyrophosphatase MutT (NUDIX family)
MIEAAGGVVLRVHEGEHQVLIVHRVRYDDWSLPKGKLDPGESAGTAALREVEEETGVRTRLGVELPDVTYDTAAGPKHVRWFRLTHPVGDPARRPADHEVDEARWVAVEEATSVLTYDQDVKLLEVALDGGRT